MKKIFMQHSKKKNFISLFSTAIDEFYPLSNKATNKKYTSIQYAYCITEVLTSFVSWRKYNGKFIAEARNLSNGLINGRVLNNKHNDFIKKGVYDYLFKLCVESYFKKNPTKKLKSQSIDSSFVSNKYGSNDTFWDYIKKIETKLQFS